MRRQRQEAVTASGGSGASNRGGSGGVSGSGVHPLLCPVGPILLFPDGNHLFECIDQPPSGCEPLIAMRCADRDGHADVSQLEQSESMDNRDLGHGPAVGGLFGQFPHLGEGHGGVGFVFQPQRLSPRGKFPHGPQEQQDGAGLRRTDPFRQRLIIDWLVSEFDVWSSHQFSPH